MANFSHAPLHGLAHALGSGDDLARAIGAARRLTRIGHSSGWDMLAGFVAGASGVAGTPRAYRGGKVGVE